MVLIFQNSRYVAFVSYEVFYREFCLTQAPCFEWKSSFLSVTNVIGIEKLYVYQCVVHILFYDPYITNKIQSS